MENVDAGERTDAAARPSLIQRLRRRHRWLDHLVRTAQRYNDNHGDHYAAAITYFSVLALVPLLMIGFSVLGFVLFNQPDLIDDIKDQVAAAAPPGLDEAIDPLIDTAVRERTTVGIIGLVGAAYSGLGWMGNLRAALTAQWEQAHQTGSFLKTKGFDALALLGLGVAIVASIAVTAAGAAFPEQLAEWLGLADLWWAKGLLWAIALLLALFGNWLVFLWVVARLPREPVTLRSAAKAALIGAIGFEILKQGATLFLKNLSGPAGAVFGPVVGLLVFVFLVSRFLLFVTAWAATALENQREVVPAPVAPAVIRPAVTVHNGPDGRTATGLIMAGAVAGLGLGWLLKRR